MNDAVVVCEPIHQAGLELLSKHFEIVQSYGKTGAALVEDLRQAEACVVRACELTADMIGACPKLKVIAKHGVGVDAIDINAASRHGIVVANTPGTNALSVAEASVALMFAVHRKIHDQHQLVLEGDFAGKDVLVFRELTGKTLGLVGGGNIGALIAKICGAGFAMQVLLFDPYMSKDSVRKIGVEKVYDLDDMLRRADIVSIQTPLTDSTRGMIGTSQLAAMKQDAILINVARGGVIDETALVHALQTGEIAAAGIDTYEAEPTPTDHPLLRLSNVALTPHSGGSSLEGLERTALAAAHIVFNVLSGKAPDSMINPDVWDTRRR